MNIDQAIQRLATYYKDDTEYNFFWIIQYIIFHTNKPLWNINHKLMEWAATD